MAAHQGISRAFPAEDRITALPDELRLQILSLLPGRYAVRTGVLSKSWKDFWKQRFNHPTTLKYGHHYCCFKDQVELTKVLQRYTSEYENKKIEAFQLYFHPDDWSSAMVPNWIEKAIANGTEDLYLDFSQGLTRSSPNGLLKSRSKKFKLTESVFRSNRSLVSLSLGFCILRGNYQFRYFDCLETLRLQGVNTFNAAMLSKVLVNCQQLQNLELRECMGLRYIQVKGDRHRIKKLTVVHCSNIEEIHISAPVLQSFHFFGKFPRIFTLGFMPCLSNVIVMSTVWDYKQTLNNNWGLDSVQVLTLCSLSLQLIFGSGDVVRANLNNLQELHLRMEKVYDTDLLNVYKFFEQYQFPQLEILFIELPVVWSFPDWKVSLQKVDKDPPMQKLENLKVAKLNNFEGFENELLIVEFLLQNAIKLERIILVFPDDYSGIDDETNAIDERLKQKPKASPDAQVYYKSQNNHATPEPVHEKIIKGLYTHESRHLD